MKATLKLDYDKFLAELVATNDGSSVEAVAPEGYAVVAAYQFDGGAALNVYSQFKQKFVITEILGDAEIPAETGVLVIQGNLIVDGKNAEALTYIKPRTKKYNLEGEALVYLVS